MAQWTDRIRQVKMILVVVAVIIAAASLAVSHFLVRDLAIEEENKMGVWAEAMRSLNNADESTDLNLVLKVIDDNNTIPVIVTDEKGTVQTFRNVPLKADNYEDSIKQMEMLAKEWQAEGRVIRIDLGNEHDNDALHYDDDDDALHYDDDDDTLHYDDDDDALHYDDDNVNNSVETTEEGRTYMNVMYEESLMIKRLATYPYVQLGIVLIFVVIAIFALLTSKRAEQNKVWVGLSKETAHQLGTPLSSMMAWTEVLKETYPDDELIPEMEKDVKRLERIAERFSKIGSTPELAPTNLTEITQHVVAYMDRRTSHRVKMETLMPLQPIVLNLNASLFEWVIENLCKNAVDAMEGSGRITIMAQDEGERVIMEVSDTGKGIARRNLQTVFKPGFTTKKRGWGLGLSLAKRIVEEYHHGRIYVLRSEVGVGTTFRIELSKK